MPKYVKMLTPADVKRESDADPELAKFIKESDKRAGDDHFAVPMKLALPAAVMAWIEANETPEVHSGAVEAFGHLFMRCAEMLIPKLSPKVLKRLTPTEALGVLADEVIEAVFAMPFKEAGVEARPIYQRLCELTCSGLGQAGVMLTAVTACAHAGQVLDKMADERGEGAEIDPALAAKATHNDHVTVQ